MVDFVQMKSFARDPLIMVRGEGVYLIDVEGRRHVDGLSGVFSVSLGHANDEIVDAVTAQLKRLAFSSPIMTTVSADRALELAAEADRHYRRAVRGVQAVLQRVGGHRGRDQVRASTTASAARRALQD